MQNLTKVTDTYTLSNGYQIPCVGFGTWQSPDGETAYNATMAALKAGYRHIDTAAGYGNEASVGKAINDFMNESGVKREEIFITTKLNNPDHGYENTVKAIETSLQKLGLSYIDLYLIHWPNPIQYRDSWKEADAGSWKAMEEAYNAGKLKALGLSNFWKHHIDAILEVATVKPMVNQLKLCPGISQDEVVKYSRSLGMVVEAYSPMGTGGIFENAFVQELSRKYNRSIAQICIRFSLQCGYLPLPKSVTPERIQENMQVFDFELDECDVKSLKELNIEGLKITALRDPDQTTF
ncbi:MAG: aldo/keto reductase [Sphaerochaetaceae bacterium]|nr:aldo/keto reductase [Sphaerochaetaceae bacterium]